MRWLQLHGAGRYRVKPADHNADWPTVEETPSERSASDHLKGGPLACTGRLNPPADREVGMAHMDGALLTPVVPSATCPDAGICARSRHTPDGARRRGTSSPTNDKRA